jgi:hypothetical protein
MNPATSPAPASAKNSLLPAYHCTCCDRKLNESKMVWLELDTSTGKYTEGCDESVSQGWFAFGPGCAKKALKKAWPVLAGEGA